MKTIRTFLVAGLLSGLVEVAIAAGSYAVAPTGQRACYGTTSREIGCAGRGEALGGQDAYFARKSLRYRDNGDGTVSDLNTGLVWQKEVNAKVTWNDAVAGTRKVHFGGFGDWRLPTIKELYSLMDFSGSTPVGQGTHKVSKPYIDTAFFDFRYGDPAAGERIIDAQYWSSTGYSGLTMIRDESVFGVNFADGRIKAYPKMRPDRGEVRMFVRYVRGNPSYGSNEFVDNHDGTVTDRAAGLMWMQADSGTLNAGPFGDGHMNWPQALEWAGRLRYAGYGDWRLPNAKELQSLVDYTRSPQATGSPAISSLFTTSIITDEGGRNNYPFYWTSTTHLDGPGNVGSAVYVAFGEALGFMHLGSGEVRLLDVHGAGAQRSDPKQGNPADYPYGMGPQGDVRRIYNHVRLVRNAK